MKNVFNPTNLHKNVKLKEVINGIEMSYTLSCPKDFPQVTFISRNKAYYTKTLLVPYDLHMSKRLEFAYNHLKANTMLELALYKQFLYNNKVNQLRLEKIKFSKYND